MKKRIMTFLTMSLLMVLIAGCGSSDESTMTNSSKGSSGYAVSTTTEMTTEMEAPAMEAYDEGGQIYYDSDEEAYDQGEAVTYLEGNGSSEGTLTERKVIKTGYVYLETTDYQETIEALKMMIDKYNGYTSYSQNSGGGMYDEATYRRSSRYTIKVPAIDFENMYEEVQTIGHALNANEGKEDVTSQFVDIEARLKTLSVQEERLLNILEKTETLEDVIELEYALQDTRYEIERYTTSLRDLSDRVSYSTLEVNVQEVQEETKITPVDESFGEKMSSGLADTFKDIKDGFLNLILFMVVEFPYILFTIGVIVFGVWLYKKLLKADKKAELTAKNEMKDEQTSEHK